MTAVSDINRSPEELRAFARRIADMASREPDQCSTNCGFGPEQFTSYIRDRPHPTKEQGIADAQALIRNTLGI